MSQHIGNLKDVPAFSFFIESLKNFFSLYHFTPEIIVCDSHPAYISSDHARVLARESGIMLQEIQHHHAHIASCMAEHDMDEKVIGISFDGTGYGNDGNIWGGEFLIADPCTCIRYAHFDYIPMPGGEMAVREPWRMALSFLYHYFGKDAEYMRLPSFQGVITEKTEIILKMLEKKINSPLTSSAGRLFDAVSALTGVCLEAGFESEGPMRLEFCIAKPGEEYYPFSVKKDHISWEDTFIHLIHDIRKNMEISQISGKFHNTIAQVIRKIALMIREEHGLSKVILSGGVFQNKYLLEKSMSLLKEDRFRVFTSHRVSVNDSGIALGQLYITAKKRALCV